MLFLILPSPSPQKKSRFRVDLVGIIQNILQNDPILQTIHDHLASTKHLISPFINEPMFPIKLSLPHVSCKTCQETRKLLLVFMDWKNLIYYVASSRPKGLRRCPGRGNAGGAYVFCPTFCYCYVLLLA